jgi:DNA-binding cell septation regulator SpoVG
MAEKIETLDCYVKQALDFFEENKNPTLELPESSHTLVVGSQTGLLAGRIAYRFAGKSFSHAKEVLAQSEIDAKRNILEDVTIVSATGSRQVVPIARYALDQGLRVNAILCNDKSELVEKFGKNINDKVFSALQEPPTINTSTYGSMIQAVTQENLSEIRQVVESLEEPEGGYGQFKAFSVIFTDSMPEVAEMVDWKIRGENIGRCIGSISTHLTNYMHGAAINDADKELYIAMGLTQEEKDVFEQVLEPINKERKYYIDVPDDFGPLGFMLLGYSVVGQIQKNYPGFQENIGNYEKRAKTWTWLLPPGIQK